jgi:hypothetical protein
MRIVKTFAAKDQHGSVYTIHVMKGDHDVGAMLPGARTSPDALGELKTDDGRDVVWLNRGIYDIHDGARMIRVTSDDPNAL